MRTESDGHPSYVVPGDSNMWIHGGSSPPVEYVEKDPSDVIAVHHRFQARLVVNDPTKPMNATNTHREFEVGVDFKQQVQSVPYQPGVGGSRCKLVTTNWQMFSFTTVIPNGMTNVNTPINPNLKVNLTEQELLANLPPGISP